MQFALYNFIVTDMAFVLTKNNVYLTTDRTIKSAMKAENQKNFKNCSQQEGLSLYFQLFCFITLTPFEPSTSLKTHYAVPHSLCRRTHARCFAAPIKSLLLVSTRILSIRWTPLYRREMASSPSARCLAVGWLSRHTLFARCVSSLTIATRSLSQCFSARRTPQRVACSGINCSSLLWDAGLYSIVSLLECSTPPDNAIRYFLSKKRKYCGVKPFNSKALV
jgi:hypothetical protein